MRGIILSEITDSVGENHRIAADFEREVSNQLYEVLYVLNRDRVVISNKEV